ncbi:Omega-hydroxypalmitate O-feruloyl transferase [Apostasia shenzhenica]|uniref:Omega-hydroxypalmitate O-feruloyl transferase n=1 Tax=Apostasia shenzhenica TaxID=1088818 RepID=A0A2I0B7W5_9ASPA|nr:Omega-hydroxypalmitate O-feruloyl transferase [Apostasia shenzhenica]
MEIPDCYYPSEPVLVAPGGPTPKHTLYLSNLDDQIFLRFSIKYLYLFKRAVGAEILKLSLSRVLEEYYPLAGRVRASGEGDRGEKLEVDCNGEGALFAEAFLDLTAAEFLEGCRRPNRSWRKLLYRVDAPSFVAVPPLVVQVTHLQCGGMILCIAICHCLCDGIGSAQFLQAWAAQASVKPVVDLPISPFHCRHVLKPRVPPHITFSHPEFTSLPQPEPLPFLLSQFLQCQHLVPISATFTPEDILRLKKLCVPSLKCTSFETVAAHVWRSWARALDLPPSLQIKLLFSFNVREKLEPELPEGFYGNGFVLACAESTVEQLLNSNTHYSVKQVQEAKGRITDELVRSLVDMLEMRKVKPDLSASLVISQWSKLGLEDLDFGEGGPLHMGPLASEIYCLFLPVIGDFYAFNVLMSMPEKVADKFEQYLKESWSGEGEGEGG